MNVSYNNIEKCLDLEHGMNLINSTSDWKNLKMLDISNNPIIDLDERFFKNFSSH